MIGDVSNIKGCLVTASSPIILLAEDLEDDVIIVRKALVQAFVDNPLRVVRDGEEAISYLGGVGKFGDRSEFPLPGLLLLDIKMPRVDGFEVLQWVRSQPQFRKLPVIILTSSEELHDMKRAYQLGANSFLLKPLNFKDARQIGHFLPSPSPITDCLPGQIPTLNPQQNSPPNLT